MRLSEINFKIEYKKGQDNVIADVLSRPPFAGSKEGCKSSDPFRQSFDILSTADPVEAPIAYCTAPKCTEATQHEFAPGTRRGRSKIFEKFNY